MLAYLTSERVKRNAGLSHKREREKNMLAYPTSERVKRKVVLSHKREREKKNPALPHKREKENRIATAAVQTRNKKSGRHENRPPSNIGKAKRQNVYRNVTRTDHRDCANASSRTNPDGL
jgi:hypothetical protein